MSQRILPPQQNFRSIITVVVVALVSASTVVAQSVAPPGTTITAIPVGNDFTDAWQVAQAAATTQKKLIVVTVDQPDRRQSCRVQSFTEDKLVCSRGLGAPRTYLPQQIAALILPGFNENLRMPLFLGANAGLGAAIWGTVALAAACPVCAAGTGIAALICFAIAGTMVYGDSDPDRVLYLAPAGTEPQAQRG